jgi:glyoxylase-like metal-dependent hydrolase (beta-lactamase superfamily II)
MVERWDVITIGNVSRNRYWGEGDDRARRAALCTCTLLSVTQHRVLIDPSLADPTVMAAELDRRSGLAPRDIDLVVVTHGHGDHHAGLACFPDATWMAAPPVAEALNDGQRYAKELVPIDGRVCEGVELFPTPGHTPDHHSLRFTCDGARVVVAGDAVLTRDFFKDRRGYFNSIDPALASRTIERIAAEADLVVPGHDNYFRVGRAGR